MKFPGNSPLLRIGELSRRLGVSTPIEELQRAVDASHPGLVVLAATRAETLEPLCPELAALAGRAGWSW
jgi:hypothetical protein